MKSVEELTFEIAKLCFDIEKHGWTPDRDDELGRLENERAMARKAMVK